MNFNPFTWFGVNRKLEQRRYKGGPPSLTDIDSWPDNMLNRGNRSGEIVTVDRALSYSPVWQGIDLIQNEVAKLPFLVYRRVETPWGEGKRRDRTHPVYRILHRYTGEMTSNLWMARMIAHALLYGDGYSIIHRDQNGRVEWLEWKHWDLVTPKLDRGTRYYLVKADSESASTYPVSEDDMFHLQGLVVGAVGGAGIVHYAANLIGKQLAADGYGAEFFANNATPAGFLSHPHALGEQARKNLLSGWRDKESRHKVKLLEEDIKWVSMGINPEDAQLIETAKFGVKDVARFFNLPPHKLGDDSRTSYSSVEQENRSYYSGSISKWTSRLEFESNQKLFTLSEREDESVFAEFVVDALLKADTKSRYEAHAIAVQNGFKNPNEVRAEENYNPYEGGDEFLRPLNMTEAGDTEEENTPEETPAENPPAMGRETVPLLAVRDVLCEAYNRAFQRVIWHAKREAKKPQTFLQFVNTVPSKYRADFTEILSPPCRLIAKLDGNVDTIVSEAFASICDQLLTASECQPEQLVDRVNEVSVRLREYSSTTSAKLLLRADL